MEVSERNRKMDGWNDLSGHFAFDWSVLNAEILFYFTLKKPDFVRFVDVGNEPDLPVVPRDGTELVPRVGAVSRLNHALFRKKLNDIRCGYGSAPGPRKRTVPDGELSLPRRNDCRVIESRQGCVREADPHAEMEEGKDEHQPRCILCESNGVPENQKSIPEQAEERQEYV